MCSECVCVCLNCCGYCFAILCICVCERLSVRVGMLLHVRTKQTQYQIKLIEVIVLLLSILSAKISLNRECEFFSIFAVHSIACFVFHLVVFFLAWLFRVIFMLSLLEFVCLIAHIRAAVAANATIQIAAYNLCTTRWRFR